MQNPFRNFKASPEFIRLGKTMPWRYARTEASLLIEVPDRVAPADPRGVFMERSDS